MIVPQTLMLMNGLNISRACDVTCLKYIGPLNTVTVISSHDLVVRQSSNYADKFTQTQAISIQLVLCLCMLPPEFYLVVNATALRSNKWLTPREIAWIKKGKPFVRLQVQPPHHSEKIFDSKTISSRISRGSVQLKNFSLVPIVRGSTYEDPFISTVWILRLSLASEKSPLVLRGILSKPS